MVRKLGNISSFFSRNLPWINSRNLYLAWFVFFLISIVLSFSRSDMPFTSQWDEMYHLSYVQYASQGIIPAWGYPMNDWSKTAFSCYPVSLLGITTGVPCDQIGDGANYPTGGTNTAAVWPPVYYFLTAILIAPIKMFFGITDNLFAARYATGIIWAAGTAFLSLIVRIKSRSLLLGLTFSLLATSFSLLGQSASFVSPHSTVPALLALGLFIAFRVEKIFQELSGNGSFMRAGVRWRKIGKASWPLIIFGAVLALTVPHAFPTLIVLGIFLFVGVMTQFKTSVKNLFGFGTLTAILFGATAGVFFGANRIWEWQQSIRAVPFPSDVNVEAADVTALGSFPNIIRQIVTLWWDFWPFGLSNPWLQGEAAIFIENFWIFLLAGLILTALATLGVGHWLFRLSLGLVITAPLASNLAFSTLQFAIPERYGMAVVLLGLFGVGNEKFTRVFRLILFFGALATYVISFFYSPLPFAESVCPRNQFNGILGCVLP